MSNRRLTFLESIKQKLYLARLVISIIYKKKNLLQYFIPLNSNLEHQHMFTSPHLSSSGPVAHKAEVNLLHLVLSAATRLASFQLFHPSIRLSFSIVDRHVVFGRPTFLLPSGVHFSAVSQLLFFSIRRICPTHFHLLNLTSVLIVFNFSIQQHWFNKCVKKLQFRSQCVNICSVHVISLQ